MTDINNKTDSTRDLSTDHTGPISTQDAKARRGHWPYLPHSIRIFAIPIILAWVVVTVLVNVLVPTLEVVGEAHSAPMTPLDAPSMKAMMRMGHNFHEFDSNSTVMIVLEGQQPLGPDAHQYYDKLIRELRQDPKHIQHIQDFWGDRLTAAGAQSADAKAAYVQVNLAGNQGTTLANESVDAVRKVIAENTAPPGVKAYVTGPAALSDDMHIIGNASLATITLFTLGAIAIMLLLVYRSISTTLIQLFMTFVALACSRGVVAVLAYNDAFGLTTFAANILTMLAIAAGTDYGIFLVGRYQEAIAAGEDRETAYYTTFKGVAPVVLGSGLTIAGATYCLSFSRLPWFNTMGAPVAIGMLVVVAAGLTLGPAVVFIGSRFGMFEKQAKRGRLWRRVGTAVVRWPAPILAVSAAIVMVGMVALPSFKTSYNDRHYLPLSAPSNQGQEAANRHFSEARMNPDLLMVESDHDMRNPADMLVLDRVAKNEMRTLGIAMVQDITRPLGIPIQHSSIPFQNSIQSQTTMQNMGFLKDRIADILKMADDLQTQIDTTQRQYEVSHDLANAADDSAKTTAVTSQITDRLARPHRGFRRHLPAGAYVLLLGEALLRHSACAPGCGPSSTRWTGSIKLAEQFHFLTVDIQHTAKASRDLTALFPTLIATLKTTRGITLTLYQTFTAMINQMEAMSDTAIVMGQSFDTSKNDDFFYLPPEAFQNPDFQTGLRMFLSPDGKSARFFITHQGDPMTPEGIARVDAERTAAQEGLKQSSLSDAKVYLGGTAATFKDMDDGAKYDLMIAVVSALTLIFMIMLLLTRSVVAALVIVSTAASSIAASFGLSVLIWQDLVRHQRSTGS